MPRLHRDRHEKFCREFLVDLNASQAYIRAGYSPKGANTSASKLLSNPRIQARIAELKAPIEEKLKTEAESITRHWVDLASADPNELTALVRGACRYCHGEGHRYQHRTEDEFNERREAWGMMSEAKRDLIPAPDDAGGYGYSPKAAPHPQCPMCDGDGEVRLKLGDTTKLSPGAKRLFAGVKQTKDGIEVKMHDQSHAVDQLARRLNLFADDNKDQGVTDLAAVIAQINGAGSSAPIVPEPKQESDDE